MRPAVLEAVNKHVAEMSANEKRARAATRRTEDKKTVFFFGGDESDCGPVEIKIRSPRPRAATLANPALASPKLVGSPMRLPSADRVVDVRDYHDTHVRSTSFGGIVDQKELNRRDMASLPQVAAVRLWSDRAHASDAKNILSRLSGPAALESLTSEQQLHILTELSQERLYSPALEYARPAVVRILRHYLHPIPLLMAESREQVALPQGHACAHDDVALWQLKLFSDKPIGITSPLDLCGKTSVGFAFSQHLGFCFFKRLVTPLERFYLEHTEDDVGHYDGLSSMLQSIVAGLELPTQSQPRAVIFEQGELLVLHEAGHGTLASLRFLMPRFTLSERLHMLEHMAASILAQVSTINDCKTAYGVVRPETLGWDAEGRIYLTHQNTRAAYGPVVRPLAASTPCEAKQFFKAFVELDKTTDVASFLAPERLFTQHSRASQQASSATRWSLPITAPSSMSDDLWSLGVVLRDLWLAGDRKSSQSLPRLARIQTRKQELLRFALWHDAVALDQFPDACTYEPTLRLETWQHHTQELEAMLKQRRGLAFVIHQILNHPDPAMRKDGFAALDELNARIAAPHPQDTHLPGNSIGALTQLKLLDLGHTTSAAAPRASRLRPWSQPVAALFTRAASMTDPWSHWRSTLQAVAEGRELPR